MLLVWCSVPRSARILNTVKSQSDCDILLWIVLEKIYRPWIEQEYSSAITDHIDSKFDARGKRGSFLYFTDQLRFCFRVIKFSLPQFQLWQTIPYHALVIYLPMQNFLYQGRKELVWTYDLFSKVFTEYLGFRAKLVLKLKQNTVYDFEKN